MEKPVELSEVHFEATYIRPDGTKPLLQAMVSRVTNAPREQPTQYHTGWKIQQYATYVRLTHPDTWDHYIPLARVTVAFGK